MNTPQEPSALLRAQGRSTEDREWQHGQEQAARLLADWHSVCLVLEAPLLTPEALLLNPPHLVGSPLAPSVFWHESEPGVVSETSVGFGTFAEASDDWGKTGRMAAVAEAQLKQLKVVGASAAGRPRFFAMIGFDTARKASSACPEVWNDFDAAWACLPRLGYVCQTRGDSARPQRRAFWLLCLAPSDAATLEQLLAQLHAYGRKARSAAPLECVPADPPIARRGTAPETWSRWVHRALEDIGAGRLEKVVAARYAQLAFRAPVSPAHTLFTLGQTHPASTRFAFFRGGSVFLGATPERLVAREGLHVRTAALAGTVWPEPGSTSAPNATSAETHQSRVGTPGPSAGDLPVAVLATSPGFGPKEYSEHSPVLSDILAKLAPLCSQVSHDLSPSAHAQRGVTHLRTEIQGVLRTPQHVLDLVRELHPTPAVGGNPTAGALAWIAEHEDFERGLYAGPVGWFDVDGDGHFEVALRCGVVESEQLTVFAGAGIVAGSESRREFVETEKKMHVLLGSVSHYPAPGKAG